MVTFKQKFIVEASFHFLFDMRQMLYRRDSVVVQTRWPSGCIVRLAVGRPGLHSSGRFTPKTLENGIQNFPAWR